MWCEHEQTEHSIIVRIRPMRDFMSANLRKNLQSSSEYGPAPFLFCLSRVSVSLTATREMHLIFQSTANQIVESGCIPQRLKTPENARHFIYHFIIKHMQNGLHLSVQARDGLTGSVGTYIRNRCQESTLLYMSPIKQPLVY